LFVIMCTIFKILLIKFFYHPKDILLIYHKFDYKSQKLTLIACTRWLSWRKKNRPNQKGKIMGHNAQIYGELHFTFRTIF